MADMLGGIGWELVSVVADHLGSVRYYFKRLRQNFGSEET